MQEIVQENNTLIGAARRLLSFLENHHNVSVPYVPKDLHAVLNSKNNFLKF